MAATSNSSNRQLVVVVVAILAIIGSAVALFRFTSGKHGQVNPDWHAGLGARLAVETGKLLNGRGRVVVVISPAFQQPKSPLGLTWQAFQDGLKAQSGIEIVATEVVTLDEDVPEFVIRRPQFEALLDKHAGVNAIVSLVGPPALGSRLPSSPPLIIAIHHAGTQTKKYFAEKLVNVMLTQREAPAGDTGAAPKSPAEWFDRYYQVIDAANHETLPD